MIRETLENGKHVICEKPITIMHTELKGLFDLAHEKHLVLMEANNAAYIHA
jgi:predicted dehydrogenase